jgi:hypothetical protein
LIAALIAIWMPAESVMDAGSKGSRGGGYMSRVKGSRGGGYMSRVKGSRGGGYIVPFAIFPVILID